MAKEIVLTPEGREKLEQELHELETNKRVEIGERIRIAREFGDISENSEYDDAKNEQAWLESRIAEISQILANATIVEAPKRSNKVSIGSVVTVQTESGDERVFTLVGAAEADVAAGRISNESPVGAALLGAKKGDAVTAEGPTGKQIAFTIVKISR
ncbi:MAG: transcription elongation factor GreA [Coriobacteriales bacterium]|jgi:transcription elongation factor GreA|nr:transcription elongation factor GreA [Coriobacteriales bacterium]